MATYLAGRVGIGPKSHEFALANSAVCALASRENYELAADAASQFVNLIEQHHGQELSELAQRWRTKQWEYQGRLLAQRNQWEQAAAQFTKVVELGPEWEHLRKDRARAYVMLGRWSDAADDLARWNGRFDTTSYDWCAQAALQLRANDRKGYESTCLEAIHRLPGAPP